MDKREIDMYRIEEAVRALLDGIPIKQIARRQKISKNTVKKYRGILEGILKEKPWLESNFDDILNEFRNLRSKERYSQNHGWLSENEDLVNDLSGKCDNYVRLFEVLQEKGFAGSYSSLQRYVTKNNLCKD